MKTPTTKCIVGLMVCVTPELVVSTTLAAPPFTLTRAVPQDVFFCAAARHNPDREFLDAYWSEVFDTLKSTGVVDDAVELIGSFLGEEQRTEVDRLKTLATGLLEGIDWKALCHGEVLFAERMSAPISVDKGQLELVLMFRGTEESTSKNFLGLKAILKGIADETNKASGDAALVVVDSSHMGVETSTLKFKPEGAADASFSISMARHGDVILLVEGDKLFHETLGLLTGHGSDRPLSESPRFKAAFAQLPPAGDALSFFDMRQMLGTIRSVIGFVAKEQERKSGDSITNAAFCKEANALNAKAIKAYRHKDHKKALTLITKAHELAPKDSLIMYNVACFQALNGHKDVALSWLEKSVDAGFYSPAQISGDADLVSLRDDPRYTTALRKAEKSAAERKAEHVEDHDKVKRVKQTVERLIDSLGIIDYVAQVEYTKGYSVHSETLKALVPDAAEKRIYRIFGSKKPLTDYQHYLPKETVSFSVGGLIDLNELYQFIEETVRGFGPQGEQILAKWTALQEQFGFDIRRDLLSWLSGDTISMELETASGNASVFMVKVSDGEVAGQKLAVALEFVSTQMRAMATQNPILAMLAVQTSPTTHEKLSGFHNVQIGISPQPAVCGVADGYLIFGTSAEAVALALATASGDHPNVTKNAQLIAEAVLPDGGFQSISFSDRRALGKEIRKVLEVIPMVGGMATIAIPDPKVQRIATKVLGMVAKLGPVAGKIDFYKSTATCTTFDSGGWRVHSVTNYREPTVK